MKARKRFGQNFLTDAGVIDRIMAAVAPRADEHIIEIGPGRGALTERLVDSGCSLTVIEVDRDLAAALGRRYPGGELTLIEADVLKVDIASLQDGPVRIVGNLPYNISSPLLFKVLALPGVTDMHFMLQLEVAARMAAAPGGKDYGRLSVMTQHRATPAVLFSVPPHAFSPAPKVTSAIVRLTPHGDAADPALTAALERLVRQAFSARRKTIRNALAGLLTANELAALDVDPGTRAETLSLDDYRRCARSVVAAAGGPDEHAS